jgi:hypothetical protein
LVYSSGFSTTRITRKIIMNQKSLAYTVKMFFRYLFTLTFFLHLLSCRGHLPVQYYVGDEDKQILSEATDAFQKKEFLKAEKLFRKLTGESYNKNVRQIALYGLACTKFALAENNDQLNQAFDLWYSWYKIPSEKLYVEDPRMMEPAFERIISHRWTIDTFSEKRLTDETEALLKTGNPQNYEMSIIENPSQKAFDYEKLDKDKISINGIGASGSSTEIQYLLESREKEILKLRQQLSSMEKNIKSLKNQIHAIEEIHQEIFEKKKGMRLR